VRPLEIVAIGNELLAGSVINTNAAWLSQAIQSAGFHVTRHSTLPDDPIVVKKALSEALERSSFVITTGGLGPTCDDLTRQIAADLFDSNLYYNEEVAKELIARFGPDLISLEDQSMVPDKALLLKNPVGTASALVFSDNGKVLILLPGVPIEMKAIVSDSLLPFLAKDYPPIKTFFQESVYFHSTRESDIDPSLRELQKQYPYLQIGIYPHASLVTVKLSIEEDASILEAAKAVLKERFSAILYSSSSGTIEEAIKDRFLEKGLSLSTAESCTGGAISARLASVSGASQYFLGGCVVYSNEMKKKLLEVPEKTLEAYGAVSQETVEAMLEGSLQATGSDYALAISGIAGPTGGSPEKPVGTIWAGVAKKGQKPQIFHWKLPGTREAKILRATNRLLGALLAHLNCC
jgi:nicotinamide-nucleotide amidase